MFSMREAKPETENCAVDWYWQDPEMFGSPLYHWWVLTDEDDPVHWWSAQKIKIIGMRSLGDNHGM